MLGEVEVLEVAPRRLAAIFGNGRSVVGVNSFSELPGIDNSPSREGIDQDVGAFAPTFDNETVRQTNAEEGPAELIADVEPDDRHGHGNPLPRFAHFVEVVV